GSGDPLPGTAARGRLHDRGRVRARGHALVRRARRATGVRGEARRGLHRSMRSESAMESSNGQNGITSAARPVAAGSYVERMLQSLRALGVDVAPICRAADIDREELGRPGAVVPVERLCALVQASLEQSHDEYLGLHLAERTGPVGLLGYLCRASETVGDALEAIVQSLGIALSSAHA